MAQAAEEEEAGEQGEEGVHGFVSSFFNANTFTVTPGQTNADMGASCGTGKPSQPKGAPLQASSATGATSYGGWNTSP